MRSIVVIPTYNESENIGNLIDTVVALPMELDIMIVDDGSPDGTAEIIKEKIANGAPIQLIERGGKLGLGTAYCLGFSKALEQGYDRIYQMDADFSHDPAELLNFQKALETNDQVIGSRYLQGVSVVNWPIRRLMLSWGANKYAQTITGMPINDATAGFKGFRREVLETIELDKVKAEGYSFQIEMNFRAWTAGFKIKEVPIIFVDRTIGQSKMSKKIVFEAIFMVWKLRFWKLFGKIKKVKK
ncbi:polyprenol monophosphomannose synthase [bacterium]|nr:polyprenol monophosphomannose synthase [bacterium]